MRETQGNEIKLYCIYIIIGLTIKIYFRLTIKELNIRTHWLQKYNKQFYYYSLKWKKKNENWPWWLLVRTGSRMERQSMRVTTAYFSHWSPGNFFEEWAAIKPAAAKSPNSLISLDSHSCKITQLLECYFGEKGWQNSESTLNLITFGQTHHLRKWPLITTDLYEPSTLLYVNGFPSLTCM